MTITTTPSFTSSVTFDRPRSSGLLSLIGEASEFAQRTCGGVSEGWYGAGEGRLHSSVSEPSHGRAGAGAPKMMHFSTMYRNSACDNPKPNAPIDATMFQSVN